MDRVVANFRRIRSGQSLANAPSGERIVISGVSGCFPNSNNVQHFMENLYNKIDLCDNEEPWSRKYKEIPKISGRTNNVEKFDVGFFGIPELQAHWMDPMCRLMLEKSVEALMDAGINPEELKGTKTGVFIGASFSEIQMQTLYKNQLKQTYPIVGCARSFIANRLSYLLNINGPSFTFDSGCSSSIYAIEAAYRSIREGTCEMAIVAASNLLIDPLVTLDFIKLGVLNMNTGCRPFDRDGSGYTRAEATVVVILQKETFSKRIYAKIVHSKVNVDGFKELGITHPLIDGQLQLLKDLYEECNVDPKTVAYVEAHGTGTSVGDPVELSAIDRHFCTNRDKPLLIGSVKGNMGHSEAAAGLSSLIKVLIGMNFGYIPPNIHYDNPRPNIPALTEKRLSVVTEKTKWPESSRLAGINSLGFGGSNSHLLLEKFDKIKNIQQDGVPRLVCFSGRTKKALEAIQDYLSSHDLDYEFIRLIQEIFSKNIGNHLYRGYSIILPSKEVKSSTFCSKNRKHTLYLCLGNGNRYNCSLLEELQQLTPFRRTYKRCVKILVENGIKIQLKTDEPNNYIQKSLITIIIQLGIVDTFKALNITFDYVRGFSMGEIAATYSDGVLELEEVIMVSYVVIKNLKTSTRSNNDVLQKIFANLKSTKQSEIKDMEMNEKFVYGSAEYFTSNILNSNLTTYPDFAPNAVVVSMDFTGKINHSIIQLELFKSDSNVVQFLDCIGRLYGLGYLPRVDKLFAEISFPVSSGTPMLSPLIKWDHSKDYPILMMEEKKFEKRFEINVSGSEVSLYKGHDIDGRQLFPGTGYLYFVWSLFSEMIGKSFEESRVCFENIRFLRATTFTKKNISFVVSINKEGYYEITDGDVPVISGRILIAEEFQDFEKPYVIDDDVILNHDDVYKELRMRGFEYSGTYKSIKQIKGNEAQIYWTSHWITFLDNMLQLTITSKPSRSLVIPLGIDRILIDPKGFLEYLKTLDADKLVPCYINQATNSIHTKGIQITGMRTNVMSRKRQMNEPILETYKFVPNILTTNVSTSVKVNMQTVWENSLVVNMRILEVVNDESDTLQPLCTEIVKVLESMLLIQLKIVLYTKKELNIEMKGIQIETNKVSYNRNNLIYVGSNLLCNEKELKSATSAILDDGFIITIEKSECTSNLVGFSIITKHTINKKIIYLLMKCKQQPISKAIDVSTFDNIENRLSTVNESLNRVILYAENNPISGIIGFTNCIRHEPNGKNFACFFIRDEAPKFDTNDDFYKSQIAKGVSVNIYQDGKWGTYRHLACNVDGKIRCGHFYANTSTRGDLSSLEWYQGKLSTKSDHICHVYYSALNFKDVMLASGKIPLERVRNSACRMEQECVEGFEFSGRDKDGNRVMGIGKYGSISNLTQSLFTWKVPSYWSLEDAATVPIVYLTVLKALTEANLKQGQSILIHSATGGIGQAALNICQYYNCNVFTTVGTYKKKNYLLKHYHNLDTTQIGNSRDTSFENMIMRKTNGRGVDIILNSLSEDKLHATIRCLAKGGCFIEIGRYDLIKNSRIGTDLLIKGCTFIASMLDVDRRNERLFTLFQSMLDTSVIKPIDRKIFEIDELQNAYKHMMTGDHIGKVLIKIRNEENASVVRPSEISHFAKPKFYCDPNLSYIILEGLEGFGLELADWLMLRGAKILILSSKTGITTGYQHSRIRLWNDNGVKTVIRLDDVSTRGGCTKLIDEANNLAPVGAIFNLVMKLSDFEETLGRKAYATIYLDQISRDLCPKLHQFVVFSSLNASAGNSIIERICEKRKAEGCPALAVQWGAIGDVTEKSNISTEIAVEGTLQQKIASCLDVLDKFMTQNEPVVSSMVMAEKYESNRADGLLNTLLTLLGITDINKISTHATFPELGMDSMMTTEIIQTLQRDYDVFLTANKLRMLTFARLSELYDCMEHNSNVAKEKPLVGVGKS